jgi:hypothetical protein
VTGGPWYTDGTFDHELVSILEQRIVKIVEEGERRAMQRGGTLMTADDVRIPSVLFLDPQTHVG